MDIRQFPKDTQDFIHQLCINAIVRAIENGTYKPLTPVEADSEDGDS